MFLKKNNDPNTGNISPPSQSSLFRFAIALITFISIPLLITSFWVTNYSRSTLEAEIRTEITREAKILTNVGNKNGTIILASILQSKLIGPNLYIYRLSDKWGNILISNLIDHEENNFLTRGEYHLTYRKRQLNDHGQLTNTKKEAIIVVNQLENGLFILVGKDITHLNIFENMLWRIGLIALVIIFIVSCIALYWIRKRIYNRVLSIAETAEKIISGDINKRIPITSKNDEFNNLAIILNKMLDSGKRLMNELKEVTDNIAHDLRTPLSRMRINSETAILSNDHKKIKEALEKNIIEADELIRTFNAITMVAQLSTHPKIFEEVYDLSQIVLEMAEIYEASLQEKDIKLIYDAGKNIKVKINRELIACAIVNLIENSIKYAIPKDGIKQIISISAIQRPYGVDLEISDNGPGIPDTQKENVLKRFFRLDSSRGERGSGLGLSLVNDIARAHKAKLILQDNNPGLKVIMKLKKVQ